MSSQDNSRRTPNSTPSRSSRGRQSASPGQPPSGTPSGGSAQIPLSSPLPLASEGDDREPSQPSSERERRSSPQLRRPHSSSPQIDSRGNRDSFLSSPLPLASSQGKSPSEPDVARTPSATPGSSRSPGHYARGDVGRGGPRVRRRSSSMGGDLNLTSENGEPSEVVKAYVWGTQVDIQDAQDRLKRFIKNFSMEDANEPISPGYSPSASDSFYLRMLREVIETGVKTLNLDMANLRSFDYDLYKLFVRYPNELVPIIDLVINDFATAIVELNSGDESPNITVRAFNLEKTNSMRDLNPADIDQMVSIRGMVTRVSGVMPELKQALFKCQACGHSTSTFIDRGDIEIPEDCSQCRSKHTQQLVHNLSHFSDRQQLRMQETQDEIPEGETPFTVNMCAYDELVDVVRPGDRVEITGIYRAVPIKINSRVRKVKSIFKTYVDVLHVRKMDKGRIGNENAHAAETDEAYTSFNEGDKFEEQIRAEEARLQELGESSDIYEQLTRSIAPSIYELDDVKKGLLTMLFGGTNKKLNAKNRVRGEINILLCGDPGTSKSQLLGYVHKLAPRGIYTSGRGSSAVGLTAYVTKDPETKETILESGALVLSDRGICCIDEFDKMSDNARSMLHEVMEQQTVSVAKAGIICTLNARTSVLAGANPIGSRYNPRISIIDNLDLPPSLISRFDLIYLLLDKPDEKRDRQLARHLVALHFKEPPARASGHIIPIETLTKYISYARRTVDPILDEEGADVLVTEYVKMRRQGMSRKVISATPRQLESLIRMSEALSRMKLKKTVGPEEVLEACRLMREAMKQAATDPRTGTIDMDSILTGVSAADREHREELYRKIRQLFGEQQTNSMSVKHLSEKLNETIDASYNDIQLTIRRLAEENFLTHTGDTVTRR